MTCGLLSIIGVFTVECWWFLGALSCWLSVNRIPKHSKNRTFSNCLPMKIKALRSFGNVGKHLRIFIFFFFFFFHWHYTPLWALACRKMPFHFSLSATNSLHFLTPSTWRSFFSSSFHLFLGLPLLSLLLPSSSSIGTTAHCGLWPAEQCPSIFSYLPPTLSIFSLPALEDLFLQICLSLFIILNSLSI